MTSQWHLNGASTPPLAVQVIRGEVFGTMITYPATLVWPLTLVAGLALVVWYLPVRRWIGPAALAVAGLIWLALLGVLTAWVAPGASHLLVLPLLVAAAGGLVALLLPRRSRWPVVVLTIGTVPAIVLLMPIGVGTFVSSGLPLGGASAAILVLFELVLLPVLELLFPPPQQPLGRRRAVLVPMTGILLVAALTGTALTGTALAVDRTDVAHPRRTDLTYLLDADTGQARWLSRTTEPAVWAYQCVTERAEVPEVTPRSRRGDTITLHVSSPRSAPAVVLQVDRRVTEVTATSPGLAPTTLLVLGTRPGRWPTEVRFGDLPPEGIDLTLRLPQRDQPGRQPNRVGDRLTIAAYDRTSGLADIPGFRPRPPDLERSRRQDGDSVLVSRTYEFCGTGSC